MSENKFLAERLYELGFTDLVSVIPPGATLTPSSKIPTASVGKVPGRRLSSGMWAGYDWRRHAPTLDDVRQWSIAGASLGLRADRFPGLDIDTLDPQLAQLIEDYALAMLGPAPVRTGRAPKRLLMYRTDAPFGRMRMWIHQGAVAHLVEILGSGQQYLVAGTHPFTLQPYSWSTELGDVEGLTTITREQAVDFLTELGETIQAAGLGTIDREVELAQRTASPAGDQQALLAPSLDVLAAAVKAIPNTNELFPDREKHYLKFGYAVKAAAGPDNEETGYEIFAEWAARWDGNDRHAGNDPEVVRADWRRMKGPYAVGWSWIAEQARALGFDSAPAEFTVLTEAPGERVVEAPLYSDQWLADKIIARRRGELRYVPETGKWLVWDGARWEVDAELQAESIIDDELRLIADALLRRGGSAKESRDAQAEAKQICSSGRATSVRNVASRNRAIALGLGTLDHDSWALNTPGGIIDLKTGKLGPADPDALCTKRTSVPADFAGSCPEWLRFLAEATANDRELEAYLQRLAGYCLTGDTREQTLTFIHGGGGNGKSVFLNVLNGILGDYARTAPMSTFTASNSEQHPTDIAGLVGSRLVSASETQSGKRWDEARVRNLTGGEPVSARFMRADFFTFIPQFKLLFAGNHKPEIRDMNDAMRRRIHLVPFNVKPAKVDTSLAMKLREEFPAILAWMVEGCLSWQRMGLVPPEVVRKATEGYFTEEDAVGKWLSESAEMVDDGFASTGELYDSWREWAGRNGEYPGSMKRLSAGLVARRFERAQESVTRRTGFRGIKLHSASPWTVIR